MSHKEVIRKTIFLIIFYVLLLALWTGYLWLYMYFGINRDVPHRTGLFNVLKLNPGLGIIPLISTESRLIHISGSEKEKASQLNDQMKAFLLNYEPSIRGGKIQECSNEKIVSGKRPCYFDLNAQGPCSLENEFGLDSGEPCIIVKLNKIYGWIPDPLNEENKGVLIRCGGRDPIDDQLLGSVCYYDLRWYKEHYRNYTAERGAYLIQKNDLNCLNNREFGQLDAMFYPYLNRKEYQQPLVFVKFPSLTRHVIIRIKCWAEAKNIQVNINDNIGSITFELLVD